MIKSFQEYYPDELSHCYGCGTNNHDGHQLRSYWLSNFIDNASDELKACVNELLSTVNIGKSNANEASNQQSIAIFTPSDKHTAIPGFVYGGLLASLIDCHGTGSASAMAYYNDNRELGSEPVMRFVTAGLNISYLAPTPKGVPLILIGQYREVKARKIVVEVLVYADNKLCVKGEVIAVLMPDSMMDNLSN
ncbi:PaaI family thioesterase [Litorilituus lipolyticus]|uniref:PaaI family thioesterase n=1 Tax=Litorilituus lipolyticus TaxID=2491017 RepID=A0A502L353_9GAMM|nr:PaaI family thioesterase [Litorilituus lipolyticus]TPH16443.1 PaaI family thioesterase [Litorilituus lipolyticus]